MTVEPAIYLREEGFAVRLENDVQITEHGAVDLMAHIPIEAEEIEALMQPRGKSVSSNGEKHVSVRTRRTGAFVTK